MSDKKIEEYSVNELKVLAFDIQNNMKIEESNLKQIYGLINNKLKEPEVKEQKEVVKKK